MNRLTYIVLTLIVVVISRASGYQEKVRLYDSLSSKVELSNRHGEVFSNRLQINGLYSIKSLKVRISGKPIKNALKISVFDYMGGGASPMYQQKSMYSTYVDKKIDGVEEVMVELPEGMVLKSKVLFVVYDDLKEGIVIIADQKKSLPICVSSKNEFYSSQVKRKDNLWYNLPYTINTEIELEEVGKKDVLLKTDTNLISEKDRITGKYRFIVSEDIDKDGYTDFIVNNKLFINQNGAKFLAFNEGTSFLSEQTALTMIIDVNNDGLFDILELGVDSTKKLGRLHLNNGNLRFEQLNISHPLLTNPSCFSIGYLNNDLIPDVFVGQSGELLNEEVSSFVLFGVEKGKNFSSNLLRDEKNEKFLQVRSSAIADFDNDGKTELFISTLSEKHTTVSYFVNYLDNKWNYNYVSSINAYEVSGCSWDYVDKDDYLDILMPQKFIPTFKKDITTNVFYTTASETIQVTSENFSSRYSGGGWADFNGDGLQDFVMVSDCECSFLQVFIQKEGGDFVESNQLYDIPLIKGVKEIAVVDMDNNNMPDIICISNDSIVVLRNTYLGKKTDKLFVEGSKSKYGCKVKVYTNKGIFQKQNIAGKGTCVQEPFSYVNFPVDAKVDSVLYIEPNGAGYLRTESLPSNSIIKSEDMIYRAYKDAETLEISVRPNPATDKVTFTLNDKYADYDELMIENASGQIIHTIPLKNTQTIVWDCMTNGGKLSSGIYYVVVGKENKVKAAKFVIVN